MTGYASAVYPAFAVDITQSPYNAKADEKIAANGAMTSGNAVLTGSGFTSADVGKTASVWVTRKITDVMWTTGTAIVTSATASFSSADVGKIMNVWGDAPFAIQTVNSGTQVTLAGTPGGNTSVVNGICEISAGLLTTVANFTNSTTITLAANWTQTSSISSANYAIATDDSTAFSTAFSALTAAGGGTLTGPAKTYRVKEVSIPSNCTVEFPAGTTFKLASDVSSTRNLFLVSTAGSSDTTFITNVGFRGRGGFVNFDQSDLQPSSGPTRGITIVNALKVLVENVCGVGLPANSGNVVHLAANSALTTPTDITCRRIRNEQVRHTGNSGIQVDAVNGLMAEDITVDGGIALRLECAQHTGDIVQNVRASRLFAGGSSGQPHSAISTSAHQNIIRNVSVDGIRATGKANGHTYTYTPHTGGTPNANLYPLDRIAIRGGYVDGGGAAVDNGAPFDSGTNNIQTDTCTWQDIKVVGATADAFKHAGGTFIRCKAEGSTSSAGFTAVTQDGVANSQNTAPPLGVIARFFGCNAKSNLTYGWDCKSHQQYELYGCTSDDSTVTTTGSNLLSAADIDLETGLGTWNAITNATVAQTTNQAYTGTHSLKITSTIAGSTEVDTATGTSGFAVTPGSIYQATAQIRSAASAADCYLTLRWYNSGGSFISQQSGPTITDITTGWTQLSALLTAPALSAFGALKITVTATGSTEIHYSDQHQVFLTTATSLPVQLYGIHGATGQNIYIHGGDHTRNGLGPTAGTSTFLFTPQPAASQWIVDSDISPTAAISTSKLAPGLAPLASPTFTGTVTLPSTPAPSDNSLKAATTAFVEQQLLQNTGNAQFFGWLAWNGDPAMSPGSTVLATGVISVSKIWVPATIAPTNAVVALNTGGTSLTTVATASVSGTQTAPSSGSWTLTTSSVSGYPSQGIVTIGSQILAYSAWSATSMTVRAGGYTPSASYTNAATITSNTNGVVLFDSSGNFIAAAVDQTTGFATNGQKVLTLIPANPTITGGSGAFIYGAIQSTGSTPAAMSRFSGDKNTFTSGPTGTLTGTSTRWGTQGTSTTGMPSAITPSSIVTTSAVSFWMGIS